MKEGYRPSFFSFTGDFRLQISQGRLKCSFYPYHAIKFMLKIHGFWGEVMYLKRYLW